MSFIFNLPDRVAPTQQDFANSRSFARYLDASSSMIKTLRDEEERYKTRDYIEQMQTSFGDYFSKLNEAAKEQPGILKAVLNGEVDPTQPIAEMINRDSRTGMIKSWQNASKGWADFSQANAASDPGTMFGYSGRALGAQFAGSNALISSRMDQFSPEALNLIDQSLAPFKAAGIGFESDDWGGLGAIGDTVVGLGAQIVGDPYQGARLLAPGGELWYTYTQGDPAWKANPEARKEIASVIFSGPQGETLRSLGMTEEDITEAPSLAAAMVKANVRVLDYQSGVALANSSTSRVVLEEMWDMVKAMPSDPDTAFEMLATVAIGVATGGVGFAAGGARMVQARLAKAGYKAFERVGEVNRAIARLSSAAGRVAGGLETTARSLQAARKVMTPTTWGEELILPTIRNYRYLTQSIATDTAEGLAIKELTNGSIYGIAMRNALFDTTTETTLSGLAANMVDGAIGEMLAYAATRDEETDFAKFIYGDDIDTSPYQFTMSMMLEQMGYGAFYGAILGQSIKTATAILTSPAKMASQVYALSNYQNMIDNIKKGRELRRQGYVQSTLLDLASGGIRSRYVVLENFKSGAISRGLVDPSDAKAMANLERVVDIAIASGVDVSSIIHKAQGDPVKFAKLVKKHSRTNKSRAKRKARERAQAQLNTKENAEKLTAVHKLNTERVSQMAEDNVGIDKVDNVQALDKAIETAETPEQKAFLEEVKEKATAASDLTAEMGAAIIVDLDDFDLLDPDTQGTIVNTTLTNLGLNPTETSITRTPESDAQARAEAEEKAAAATQEKISQLDKIDVDSRRAILENPARTKGQKTGFTVAELKEKAKGLGITFGKGKDLPAKATRQQIVDAIIAKYEQQNADAELGVTVEVDEREVSKRSLELALASKIKEANNVNNVLASVTDIDDAQALVTNPGAQALDIYESGTKALTSGLHAALANADVDARNPGALYKPREFAAEVQKRYDKLKGAIDKLPQDVKEKIKARVSVYRNPDGSIKPKMTQIITMDLFNNYGINVGVGLEEAASAGEFYLKADQLVTLYEQISYIKALDEVDTSKLSTDEKLLIGDHEQHAILAKNIVGGIRQLTKDRARRGEPSDYVPLNELLKYWPEGYHNLLHSAFGDAEAIDYGNGGEILFHLPLLTMMAEERLARSAEDLGFKEQFKQEVGKRLAKIDALLRSDTDGRIRNKLIKHRNRAMVELTASRFIREESSISGWHRERVDAVIEKDFDGDIKTYLRTQENAFVLGVLDALMDLPKDSLAITNLGKRIGISGLLQRSSLQTPGTKNVHENPEAVALAMKVAAWAQSKAPGIFGELDPKDKYSGVSNLWNGNVDSADGYTVGRALIEAVSGFRSLGTSEGVEIAGDALADSTRGYLGHMSNRAWFKAFEQYVQDKTNEYILFDEKGNRRLYTNEDIESRLKYYDEIEQLIEDENWEELELRLQDTQYSADLKKGIAPQQVIKDLSDHIKGFRKTYEERVQFVLTTPSAVIHTLHDQAASMHNAAAAFHIFGNLPTVGTLRAPSALVNAIGDTGLKTAVVNPGSFKDAWAVKSSRMWGTAKGMAKFARAAGRLHLGKVLDELGDDVFKFFEAVHSLKDLEIEIIDGKVKILNDEDASAQAVTVAQSIYDDFYATRVQEQIIFETTRLPKIKEELIVLEAKKPKTEKDKKRHAQLKRQEERAKKFAEIVVTIEDGVTKVSNVPEGLKIPGLDQMRFKQFLQAEESNLRTIGGGDESAAALARYLEQFTDEKGEDKYSMVGIETMRKLKERGQKGWTILFKAAGIENDTTSLKALNNPVATFLRNEIFKPPVMTTVYSAGRKAFRGNMRRALKQFIEEEISNIADPKERAALKADLPDMITSVVDVLAGKGNEPGTIKDVLGLPGTGELLELLSQKNDIIVSLPDATGGMKPFTITPEMVVDPTLLSVGTETIDAADYRAAVLKVGERYFGSDVSLATALWTVKLESMEATGEISRAAKLAAIERMHMFNQEALQLAAQEQISFDEALNRVAKPVSSYLMSMELMNKVAYTPHAPNIAKYLNELGLTEDDLDSLTRAHVKFNTPFFMRNRSSTGRAFKVTDAAAGNRPLQSESSTEETIGIGDEQLGTRNIADSFASIVKTEDSEAQIRTAILQDMEMELGGIIKPQGFKDPTGSEFVEATKSYGVSAEGQKSHNKRLALYRGIDERIAAFKKRIQSNEELSTEDTFKYGMLVEIKKMLVTRDERGQSSESLDRNFLPSTIRPERRFTSPDAANVRYVANKGIKENDTSKGKRVSPTQLGVPALQELYTVLNNRTLQQRTADRTAIENLGNGQATFSTSEMTTPSPIPNQYVAGIDKADVSFTDRDLLSGLAPLNARSDLELDAELEGELEQASELLNDPTLTDDQKIAALRSLKMNMRALELTSRTLSKRVRSDPGRAAAARKRLSGQMIQSMNLTVGGLSQTEDAGTRNMFVLDRGRVAPGRRSNNQRLRTFGELFPNYAMQNKINNLVGLAVGPVEATNIHVKGGHNLIPKLTSRGPISVFFHDFMLIGGASREFTAKAYVAMFMDSDIKDPKEFVRHINERGFMNAYVEWNNKKFGVDENIDDSKVAHQQYMERQQEKVEFWNQMEDFEDGNLENHPEFQEAFNTFYQNLFEEMGTAFPSLPKIKLDENAQIMFYGIAESLEDPEYKAWFFDALGLDPDEYTNLDVALAFAATRSDIENNFFEPVQNLTKVDGEIVAVNTTFGAIYNSVEISDTTVDSRARPTFTTMQMLHMANLTKNAEIVHKLMTAAMFGVDIDLDLTMSQNLREKSDAFDLPTKPIHGFARTPLNEEGATKLRVKANTDQGFDPELAGKAFLAAFSDSSSLDGLKAYDVGVAHTLLAFGLADADGTIHSEADLFMSEHVPFEEGISKEGDLRQAIVAVSEALSEQKEQIDEVATARAMENSAVDGIDVDDDDFELMDLDAQRTKLQQKETTIPSIVEEKPRAEQVAEKIETPVTTVSKGEYQSYKDRLKATAPTELPAPRTENQRMLGTDFINKAEEAGIKFVEYEIGRKEKIKVKLSDYDDRYLVLVEVNGIKVPFYVSTGQGGKKGVPSGRWYPIFGIGDRGWLNKTNDAEIVGFYGSPELKQVAETLDSITGDNKPSFPDPTFGNVQPGEVLYFKSWDIETFNQTAGLTKENNLQPVNNGDFTSENPTKNIKRNIDIIVNRIAGVDLILDADGNYAYRTPPKPVEEPELTGEMLDLSNETQRQAQLQKALENVKKRQGQSPPPEATEGSIPDDVTQPTVTPEEDPVIAAVKQRNASRTLHSGGAIGADTTWQTIGAEFGFTVQAHSFKGHSRTAETTAEMIVEHTPEELKAADEAVEKARVALKRRPTDRPYVKNLFRRNYYQVVDSDQILAIGSLQNGGGGRLVNGGTGYAVEMALQMGKPVYLWDTTSGGWMVFSKSQNKFIDAEQPPVLTESFAGIGTRDLSPEKAQAAKEAMRKLFEQDMEQQINAEIEGEPVDPAEKPKVSLTEAIQQVQQVGEEAGKAPRINPNETTAKVATPVFKDEKSRLAWIKARIEDMQKSGVTLPTYADMPSEVKKYINSDKVDTEIPAYLLAKPYQVPRVESDSQDPLLPADGEDWPKLDTDAIIANLTEKVSVLKTYPRTKSMDSLISSLQRYITYRTSIQASSNIGVGEVQEKAGSKRIKLYELNRELPLYGITIGEITNAIIEDRMLEARFNQTKHFTEVVELVSSDIRKPVSKAEVPKTSTSVKPVTKQELTESKNADKRLLITRVTESGTPEGQSFRIILANMSKTNPGVANLLKLFDVLTGREGDLKQRVSDFEAMQLVQLAAVDPEFASLLFGGNVEFKKGGEVSTALSQHSGSLIRTMNGVEEVAKLLNQGNIPAALSLVIHEMQESTHVVSEFLSAEDKQRASGDTRSRRLTFIRDFLTPEGIANLESFIKTLGIGNERIKANIKRLKELQKKYNVTIESTKGQAGYTLVNQIAKAEADFEMLSREAFTHVVTAMLLIKSSKMQDTALVKQQSPELKSLIKTAAEKVYSVIKKIQELTAMIGKPILKATDNKVSVWGWMDPTEGQYFEKQWDIAKRMAHKAGRVYELSDQEKFKAGNGTDGVFRTVYLGGELPDTPDAKSLREELAKVQEEINSSTTSLSKRQLLMVKKRSIINKLDALAFEVNNPENQARFDRLTVEASHEHLPGIIDPRLLEDSDREFVENFLAERALRAFGAEQLSRGSRALSAAATALASAQAVTALPGSPFDDIRALLVAGNPAAGNATKALPGWIPQQHLADLMSRDLQQFFGHMGAYHKFFNKHLNSKDETTRTTALNIQRDIYLAIQEKDPKKREARINALPLASLSKSGREIQRLKQDLQNLGEFLVGDNGLIVRLAEQGYRAGIFSAKERDLIKRGRHLPFLLSPEVANNVASQKNLVDNLRTHGVKEMKARFDGGGNKPFVNAQTLRGVGAVITEPIGPAARQQFLDMPDDLRVALVDLADSIDPERRPAHWTTMEDWERATWGSHMYMDELVRKETPSVSLLKTNPILRYYREGLENDAEFEWNAERDPNTGRLVPDGRTRAAIEYDKWQKSTKYDITTPDRKMGLLGNEALKRTQQMSRTGLLTPADPIFGYWYKFFDQKDPSTKQPLFEIRDSQNYDLFAVVGGMFRGKIGDSFGTSVQQVSLGMQGMNYESLIRYLETKLRRDDAMFMVNGELRVLTKLEQDLFKQQLQYLRDQNDTLFMRKPQGVEPTDNMGKAIYAVSSLGITLASAGNWTTSVVAEFASGLGRSVKSFITGDFKAIFDYLQMISPAKRQKVLETINAHEFLMHHLGVVTKMGDMSYDVLTGEFQENNQNRLMHGFDQVNHTLRAIATYGFTTANQMTRYVSTIQGIRKVRRYQQDGRFVRLGELIDGLSGEVTIKELRTIARQAGIPIDLVSNLYYSGNTTKESFVAIDNAIAKYLTNEGFNYDAFHEDVLSGSGYVDETNAKKAMASVVAIINEQNRRNNFDPTFGNRQVPKKLLERLTAALGQFPILAFTRARQMTIQGGLAGLIGFIVPLFIGEMVYSSLMQVARGEEPEEVYERWSNDPTGAALSILENLPILGRLQPMQTLLAQVAVRMGQSLHNPDMLAGYKRQSFIRSAVNIPGLDMMAMAMQRLSRAIEDLMTGDYQSGVTNLMKIGPMPFKPLLLMGLNQAFSTDPLVSNTTGGSGVPTSTFFRGRQMPFDEYAKYRQGYRGQVAGSPTQAPEAPTMAPEGLGVPEATQTPPERQTPQEGTEELPKTPFPTKHPMVQNPDGSYSNIVTTTVGIGDRHYVIPTMVEGKQLSVREAVDVAKSYGLDKYPSFDNAKDAEQASIDIHNAQVTPSEKQQGSLPQTDWLNTHGGKGGSDLADVLDENGYL